MILWFNLYLIYKIRLKIQRPVKSDLIQVNLIKSFKFVNFTSFDEVYILY
jgi:hypothetical protein